jgi:hypothetical protein
MRAIRVLFVGLIVGLAGCQSCGGAGGGATKEDLALVPKEADVIFAGNVTRMRNTAMWRKMLDMRDSDAQTKKDFDEFVKKCGLDPLQQIDSVFIAFPQAVGDSKEFAAILRGTFNEQKLVECAKDQAKKDAQELATSEYNGKKLYTSTKQGQAFATFLDAKTVALGGKEWIKKVIDLAAGKKDAGGSAKENEPLMALLKRVKTTDAIWGAGLVPQTTRDQLKNDPNLSAAGSMKDMFGSVDFANGITADLNVDLGSDADAKALVEKINGQLGEAKKNPQFMMAGLTTFLDNVKIEPKAATFHVGITFNQAQVDDLINRIKGLLSSFRGAMGGQGGAGAPPLPPPQMPTP